MGHTALALKWRPKRFGEVVGQQFAVQALTNALSKNFLHHAYLFTGTRGVGKTTIARILAKCLNCETGITATPCETCSACQAISGGNFPDLFEIDAASRTKVEDTREILDNVQYAPTTGRFKIYLIDEVHMLSGHSFNALLKTLEEPPEHVKFLLATTDPQKLPATVLSRCLQFHLSHLSVNEIEQQLAKILTAEAIGFEQSALQLVADNASGSMRDALSLLDQAIAFGNGNVNLKNVRQMLGTVDDQLIYDLLQALASNNANSIVEINNKLLHLGTDFANALKTLLSQLHAITLLQLIPEQTTADSKLADLATQFSTEDVQLYYQIGLIGQRDLPFAPSAHNGFEMTLLRMLAFTPSNASPSNTAPKTPAAKKEQSAMRPQTQKPVAEKTSPAKINDWHNLFNAIQLSGAARMLAEQCSLINQSEDTLTLGLNPKHKALLQDAMVKRINDALNTHFNRRIKLQINLQQVSNDTPRDAAVRKSEVIQQKAEAAIYNDDNVQQIIKAFDAKVIKETIKPVTSNSGEDI